MKIVPSTHNIMKIFLSLLVLMINKGSLSKYIYSFSYQHRIEFRDAKDLNIIVLDHSVAPHSPWEICTSSNSSLWYESYDDLSEFYELDCSSLPCLTSDEVFNTGPGYGMCYAEFDGKSLLVVACSEEGLEAYNMDKKKFVWSIRGEIPLSEKRLKARRITTDKHGRLFVCDKGNKCIHIFSTDGKCVTTLLREGEQGLGELYHICWSEQLSGLIVAHRKDDKTWISLRRCKRKKK